MRRVYFSKCREGAPMGRVYFNGDLAAFEQRMHAAVAERLQVAAACSRAWSDLRNAVTRGAVPHELKAQLAALIELDGEVAWRLQAELGLDLPSWGPTFRLADGVLQQAVDALEIPADSPFVERLRYALETQVARVEDAHWSRGPELRLLTQPVNGGPVLALEVRHGWIVKASKES